MPIDASIYNNIQQPQLDSPLNAFAKYSQIQNMQNQNKLAGIQVDQAQRSAGADNALAGLIAKGGTTDDVAKGLASAGYGAQSLAYTKQANEAAKAKLDMQSATLKQAMDKQGFVAQIAGAVTDQPSLTAAKKTLSDNGIDVSQIPDVYDPAVIKRLQMQALTGVQQLDQHMKQLGFDLKTREQVETERNNKANNSVAQGQLGVAQGNLGVSRQRLAMDQAAPKGQYDATNGIIVDTRTGVARPVTNPDGTPITSAGKAPTEFQGKSAAFGSRAEQADKLLTTLESQGTTNPGRIKGIAQGVGNLVPFTDGAVGNALGSVVNQLPSGLGGPNPQQQQTEQARRDFINAVLRQESGAAIGKSEFDNAEKQYFPQPGDAPSVIAQKQANRKLAVQGFRNSAGKAMFSAPQTVPTNDIHAQADAILRGQ